MKYLLAIVTTILMIVFTVNSVAVEPDLTKNLAMNNPAFTSLLFTQNQGQWDDKVMFRASSKGATMWFSEDGAYYQFIRMNESKSNTLNIQLDKNSIEKNNEQPDSYETMLIKARFVGANSNPQMIGVDKVNYKCNYFIGNDAAKWTTDVPNYKAVMYKNLYTGIDLKYYGNGRQMEYDFIVSPGADFSQIKIQYEGAESIAVNEKGELVVTTKWGEVVEQCPVVYQEENSKRVSIDGKYQVLSVNSFSFKLDKFNPDLPLIIDPVLSYSTYLGGSDQDDCTGITVDNYGNAYLTGWTRSNDFPVTAGSFQTTINSTNFDAFVTKLNPSGDTLIYSTYFGGDNAELGWSIVLDDTGNIYLTGRTRSTDFPITAGAVQTTTGGTYYDAFIAKLNSDGDSLLYGTFLGGSDNEEAYDIALDNAGNMYISGFTESTNFPATVGAIQTTFQGGGFYSQTDAFAAKINAAGDSLMYATYLGGSGNESGWSIAANDSGNAFVTGFTQSSNFPVTVGSFQTTINGSSDSYVAKLNSSGTAMVYCTFLGGTGTETGYGIVVDSSGNAYCTGKTGSSDFPTTAGVFQTSSQISGDIFVTKLNSPGDSLLYSTYIGGNNSDASYDIVLDDLNNVYITGNTASTDFPVTADAYQNSLTGGPYDAFMLRLNASASALDYCTYIGGSTNENLAGISRDDYNNVYFAGYTSSTNFPTTPGSYQPANNGSNDMFIVKFSEFTTKIIKSEKDNTISGFKLKQNYPNPFNPTTTIEFTLVKSEFITLKVYNILGEEVATLLSRKLTPGVHAYQFNGKNLASGIYSYELTGENFKQIKRMVLLK